MKLEEIITRLEHYFYDISFIKELSIDSLIEACKIEYCNGNKDLIRRLSVMFKKYHVDNYINVQAFLYLNGEKTELNKKQIKAICTSRIAECERYSQGSGSEMWYKLRKQFSKGGENTHKSELSEKTIELVGFNSGRAKKWVKRIIANPNDQKALKKLKTIIKIKL